MSENKQAYDVARVIKCKSQVKLSGFALKVLKKLSGGQRLKSLPTGGGKLGSIMVPKSLLVELTSEGLVVKAANNEVVLSDAGYSYLRRAEAKSKPKIVGNVVGQRTTNPYLLQHQVSSIVTKKINGTVRKVNVNLAESPLGWLRKRKNKNGEHLISLDQFEAAERFRIDYEMSMHSKSMTANYDGVPISKRAKSGTSDLSFTERQLDAKKRYDKAVSAMGSGLSDSLIRLCCHLEGFEAAEKSLGWPSRSLKLVMIMALDRLAHHYKKGERPTK